MTKQRSMTTRRPEHGKIRADAENLAIEALDYLAQDAELLGRFLALSGLGPGDLRAAAAAPDFLGGVLEHVVGDERLLVAFAQSRGIEPQSVTRACALLAGPAWERDLP